MTSVYNGHFRGPMTLTPIAERLAVVLSLPVLKIEVCRGWDSNTQPSACGANARIKLKFHFIEYIHCKYMYRFQVRFGSQ